MCAQCGGSMTWSGVALVAALTIAFQRAGRGQGHHTRVVDCSLRVGSLSFLTVQRSVSCHRGGAMCVVRGWSEWYSLVSRNRCVACSYGSRLGMCITSGAGSSVVGMSADVAQWDGIPSHRGCGSGA